MDIYSKFYRKKKQKIVGNGAVSSLFDRVVNGAASKADLFDKVDKKDLLDTASGAVNKILSNSGKSTKSILKKTASYLRKKLKRGQKMRLKKRIFGARRKRKKLRGGGRAQPLYSLNRYYKRHLARRGRQILRRRRQKKAGITPVRRRKTGRRKSKISQLQLYRLGLNLDRVRGRRRRRRKRPVRQAAKRRRKSAKRPRRRRRRRGPRKKFDIRNFVKRKRKRKAPAVKVGAGPGVFSDATPSVFNI